MVDCLNFRLKAGGIVCLILCVFCCLYGKNPAPVQLKRILLIDSYSTADPWTDNLRRGLFAILNQSRQTFGAETFDLSVRCQPGLVPAQSDIDALRVKIAGRHYDLIVVSNNAAADLFLNGTLKPLDGTPILISSYHGTLQIPAGVNITGVETPVNLYDNIALAHKLLPNNRIMTVLMEGTPDGDAQTKIWQQWSESEEGRKALNGLYIRVLSGSRYSSQELMKIVASLPPDSVLLAHSWSSTRESHLENGYTVLPDIRQIFPGLILGKYVGYLDRGLTGGVMVSGEDQGRQVGALAVKILRGERASGIPVEQGSLKTILDYPLLVQAGVKEADIPADAILLNKPRSFMERNLTGILKVLGLLMVLMLLVMARMQMSRKAMKKIRGIFMSMPYRIAIIDIAGDIIYSNNYQKSLHYRNLSELPESMREDFSAKVLATFKTGQNQTLDFRHNDKDIHAELILLSEELYNRPTVMCTISDQTQLYRAHREVALLAERSRMTLESIGDAVIVTDTELRVTLLNPIAAKLIGIDPEAAKGRLLDDIFKLISYTDNQPVEVPLKKALRTGKIVELSNHTDLIALDGRRYHIADSAAPIHDPEGNITGGVLVFRDVTEEYINRDKLQDALTNLEYGTELTRSAAFRMNLQTREILSASKILPELWPIRDGKAISREEYIYPEDLEKYIQGSQKIMSRECNLHTWDYRSNFTGELRYYRMRASVDWNSSSPCLVGVLQDVTEITRNIGKLKETLEFWGLVINSLPIMFFIKDADNDFRYTLCNKAYADFHGRTPEEVIGRTDAELFSRPGDVDFFHSKDVAVMNEPDGEKYEETFADASGRLYYGQALKKPFIGSGGRRLIFGAVSDISEQTHLIACERFSNEVLNYTAREIDFDRVINYIADRLQHQLLADRVMIARINDQGLLRLEQEWNVDGVPSIYESGIENHYYLWDKFLYLLHNNKVIMLSDLSRSRIYNSVKFKDKYKIQSSIITPIFEDGKLWGAVFVCYVHSRRSFAEIDENIMRSCANVIALAAARKRREEKIRRHEQELHLLLDNIGIPIALHAADGKLLHVNPAVSRMTGMSREALLASPESEVFYTETTAPENSPLKQIIGGKKSASADLALRDHQYIVHADAVIDEQGKLINIVKDAIDVTRLNELIRNHRLLNFCMSTLFSEEDADKAVPEVLKAVCSHFGAARTYILRFNLEKKCTSSFYEYTKSQQQQTLEKNVEYPMLENEPWLPILSNGKQVLIYNLDAPEQLDKLGSWREYISRSNMKSIFITGIFQQDKLWGDMGIVFENEPCRRFNEADIKVLQSTAHLIEVMLARKANHERLVQAMEQARAAEKAKSLFIASVSHEIRTPLNSVIGFSELLRHADVPADDQKEYLSNISYSGNALLQLINDVLDLSKLEAGQMEIVPEPTDFNQLGQEVMKVFSLRAIERKLELKIEISSLPELDLDSQRIRQILFNLIGNAVKFTENGSITLRVEFRADDDNQGTVTFMIIDTGIGISQADQKRLMAPYVQVSNQYGGTGLGLSISRRLAEKMGGGLWLESEPGKGSTFGVTLKGIRYRSVDKTQKAIAVAAPEQPLDAEFSILMVDDVMLNLKVLKAMCVRQGLKDIVTVTSGAAALEELKKRTFDLVMTDIWMPEMNGFELLQKIRAEHADLPVVAVTADVNSMENFPHAQFTAILLKPVTAEKIREVIKLTQE